MISKYTAIVRRFIFSFCLLAANAHGQTISNKVLKDDVAALQNIRLQLPVEKLYLQTDKNYYNSGDTLWFKSYLLDADFLTPSIRSGLLYVELDNVIGRSVKRIMVSVNYGLAWGDIALDEKEIPQGSYTLRAYTSWMRNFGEDYIFKKNIYIAKASNISTLITADFKTLKSGDKNKVTAILRFTGLDQQLHPLQDLQMQVMNGVHTITSGKATTSLDGILNVNFDLPDKIALKELFIQATQIGKDADTTTLTIPVTINRPQNIDLKFMPEGGNLVAGIDTKIGFKAIGEDGKGIAISGGVYNSKLQEVATFKSTHKGMGSFWLLPLPGESYTARLNLPGEALKTYSFPAINASGTTVGVISNGNDSLQVNLNISPDLLGSDTYYLIGQARDVICYASVISFKDKQVKQGIATSLFPTGMARFTLLNAQNRPVNERIVYIDHRDNLDISLTTDKPNYTTRDSVSIHIAVKDKNGKPIRGSFSLAVTDASQVRADSTGSNIVNDLLLTSDLKGTVEEPGYYLEDGKATELDNLLLTQGWVGYNWKATFNPIKTKSIFPPESEFAVKGTVNTYSGKPIPGADILLFSAKPPLLMDTVTDKNGQFVFRGIAPVDESAFKLVASKTNGKNTVDINANEFVPPVFTSSTTHMAPWYVNSDTLLLRQTNTMIAQLKAEADIRGEGHQLKEVIVTEKKIIEGSKNLNGPGGADFILD
jgi:hypothetical protein